MVVKRGRGLLLFLLLCAAVGAYAFASKRGYLDRWLGRLFPETSRRARLSAGDFPAGVAAPVGELASLPLRPVRIGFTPRGSSAALLLATGAVPVKGDEPSSGGLLKSAYALETQPMIFGKEEDLRQALGRGGEAGGVDMGAISVDRLAQWSDSLRDASLRTVLLLGRSRGQEALAAVGIKSLSELRGKRLGSYRQSSSHYLAMWLLSRAGLSLADVQWVELPSSLEAGAALREGTVDAAAGLYADLQLAVKDRGGTVLGTSADAPHLVATVLVVRGEFAARFPDAVRRTVRGTLEAAAAVNRDPMAGAQLLGEAAPYLGDPLEAIKSAPPSSLSENLAFFRMAGEAPVTYDELFESACTLFVKLGRTRAAIPAEDTRDLTALKYVAEAK